MENAYQLEAKGVLEQLGVDPRTGLREAQVTELRKK